MLRTKLIASGKILLVCSTAMALTACESSGSYRVASVGSVPSDAGSGSTGSGDTSGTGSGGTGTDSGSGGTGSGAGSGSGSGSGTGGTGSGTGTGGGTGALGGVGTLGGPVLVTAGNTVIGLAGKHNELAGTVNGIAPGLTPVTGTVTAVLTKTGQTLVDVGQGQSLILNGTGKLGEVVKLDLGSKTVVGAGAGSSLLGVGVLSPTPATGSLAAVNVGNAGPIVAVGGTSLTGGGVGGVLTPVVTPVKAVLGSVVPTPSPSGGSIGLVGGVTGVLGVSAGSTQAGGTLGSVLAIGRKK